MDQENFDIKKFNLLEILSFQNLNFYVKQYFFLNLKNKFFNIYIHKYNFFKYE